MYPERLDKKKNPCYNMPVRLKSKKFLFNKKLNSLTRQTKSGVKEEKALKNL